MVLSAWSWISGILFTSIAPPRTQIALLTVELLHIVNQKQIGLKSVKLFALFRSRLGNRIVTNLLLITLIIFTAILVDVQFNHGNSIHPVRTTMFLRQANCNQ